MELLRTQKQGYPIRVVTCCATFYGNCRYAVQVYRNGWKTLEDFRTLSLAKEWIAKL